MSASGWCGSCSAATYNRAMRKPPTLQRLFLTGLLTLLPLWLTWVVAKFVFVLLSDTSRPITGPLLARLATDYPHIAGWLAQPWVQTVIALAATLLVILLSGVMEIGRAACRASG